MEFEWDESKRFLVVESRGVDFEKAALIFNGPVLTKVDQRRDYGEVRFISLGIVDGDYYVVVHTARGNAVRVITAWKGGKREREEYQARDVGGTPGKEGEG